MNLETGQLEPGDRVRCVDAESNRFIEVGREYCVNASYPYIGGTYIELNGIPNRVYEGRCFKPIVRVKAPSRRGCCNRGCDGCKDFAFRARLHRFATSGAVI